MFIRFDQYLIKTENIDGARVHIKPDQKDYRLEIWYNGREKPVLIAARNLLTFRELLTALQRHLEIKNYNDDFQTKFELKIQTQQNEQEKRNNKL